MSSRNLLFAALLAASPLAGCKKDAPATTAATPTAPGAPGGSPEVATPATTHALRVAGAAETPALVGASALSFLPKSVAAVAAVDGIEPMFERFGWSAAVKRFPDVLREGATRLQPLVGADLTQLSSLATLGVDIKGRVGAAFLRDGSPAVVIFGTVSDRAKLITALKGLMASLGVEVSEETDGDAIILGVENKRDGQYVAWVFRGNQGFMVMAEADARRIARDIGRRVEADSFAARADVAEALGELARGSHASLWLDADELMTVLSPMMRRERDWPQVERVVRDLFGRGTGLMLGAAVKEQGIELSGRLVLGADSPFRSFFKGGTPSVAYTVQGPTVFAAGARVDFDAIYATLRRMAGRDAGPMFDAAQGTIKSAVGVDLEKLSTLFTGDVGISINADAAAIERRDEKALMDSISGALVVGLAAPDRLKSVVDLARKLAPEEVSSLLVDAPNGYTLAVPKWKTLNFVFGKDYVVVSPDAALAATVAEKRAPTSPNAGIQALLRSDDLGLFLGWDLGFFLKVFLISDSALDSTPPDRGDVPAELAAKRKEAEKIRAELQAERAAAQMRAAALGGTLLGHAVPSDRGYDGRLEWVAGSPLNELTPLIFELANQRRTRPQRREALYMLQDQIEKLETARTEAAPGDPLVAIPPEARPAVDPEPVEAAPVPAEVPDAPPAPEAAPAELVHAPVEVVPAPAEAVPAP